MKTYFEEGSEKVSPKEIALFRLVERMVQEVIFPEDIEVSCHHIARALAEIFPELKPEQGIFFGNNGHGQYTHAWLRFPSGLVLDPYPCLALGGPILVDAKEYGPWEMIYKPQKIEIRAEFRIKKEVPKVKAALLSVKEKLSEAGLLSAEEQLCAQ